MKQSELFPELPENSAEKLHALMVMREMVHASRESMQSTYLHLLENGIHRFNPEFSQVMESLDLLQNSTLELSMKLLSEVKDND